MASDEIKPKLRTKPTQGEIGLIYVGRNVSHDEAKDYLIDYFREKGMLKEVVRIRMLV